MPASSRAAAHMEYTVWIDSDMFYQAFVQKGEFRECADGTGVLRARGACGPLLLTDDEVRFWHRIITFWADATAATRIVIVAVGDD